MKPAFKITKSLFSSTYQALSAWAKRTISCKPSIGNAGYVYKTQKLLLSCKFVIYLPGMWVLSIYETTICLVYLPLSFLLYWENSLNTLYKSWAY